MASNPPLPRHLTCHILVLGVGNRLFGDDGFGPCLAERLLGGRRRLPEDTCVIDAATGAARIIFDVAVSERRPALLLILDAVDMPERLPGEVFELTPAELPSNKRSDFILHQLPDTYLLAELERHGCLVRIIACQVKEVPAEIAEGLSPEVKAALRVAEELVRARLRAWAAPPGGRT